MSRSLSVHQSINGDSYAYAISLGLILLDFHKVVPGSAVSCSGRSFATTFAWFSPLSYNIGDALGKHYLRLLSKILTIQRASRTTKRIIFS